MRTPRTRAVALGGAAVVAAVVALGSAGGGSDVSGEVGDRVLTASVPPGLEGDPRVRAWVEAYGALIDSVRYTEADVVFVMGDEPIHFQDGRMLTSESPAGSPDCDPIFYSYPLGPLYEPTPVSDDDPTYCTEVLERLWGVSEGQIRGHGASTTFFGRRLFLNQLAVDALAEVEGDLAQMARTDRDVARWVENLAITYSYIDRGIAGSDTRSHHAWGLAVDFVPGSYGGRHVYWRWSRVHDREGWHEIPLEDRWTPPLRVIETFEAHGFLWGGKWAHFDNIHFEYRPEIIAYNRLLAADHF